MSFSGSVPCVVGIRSTAMDGRVMAVITIRSRRWND